MTFNIRSLLFSISIYVAFFASGAASLIAEVTWNRMLIVVVGNSMSAAALIIVVFMGGLGLGSLVGGRIFSKRRVSLIPYLLLEVTIGAFVLLSPLLFSALADFFMSLAGSSDQRGGLTFIRIAVSLAALLFPAFLMGATFPAIISGATQNSPSKRSARTGFLYSINTVGAALGCFAAGYHLLLEFGVQTTLNVAFALYLTAAISALVANAVARRRPEKVAETPVSGEEPLLADRSLRRYLAIATFTVGFVALAYEVLLTRLSILYLGNSVSVFPLVLTGFLLGTGISALLGTWFYGVLSRFTSGAYRLFGIIALASGAFVLATPYLLLTDWVVSNEQFARFADAAPRNPLPILGIIIAPTLLIGALLPIAIRMLQRMDRGEATREAATLYALNTAGGLIGAGVANHYLVPMIGIQGTVVCLAALCAGVGFVNLPSRTMNNRRWGLGLGGAAGLAVVLVLALPNMMELYGNKIAQSTSASSAEVLHIHEGRAATVIVLDQDDPRRGTYRDMYLNGVEEASTRYWHVQLFKLLGILPGLIHESEEPKKALVIAFGAGITAGSVLASDEVSSLDVVDLNPDIEGINDLFTEVNGDVFHDERFTFHNDDGRNYLVTSGKQYDLIIGDSTHPRAYDSWILYTEEFYRTVRERLAPGGIFAQWVPVLGSMQGDLFRIHLNTFRSVFPNSTFWYIYGSDQAFLMATPEPFTMNAEQLQQRLDSLPDWFLAERYQIDSIPGIAGFFWQDEAMMAKMIGSETRINTDDFHFFDKQSAVRPSPPQFRLPSFQASILPHVAGLDESLATAIREEQTMAMQMGRYGFFGITQDLFQAFCAMPRNGNVRYFMSLRLAGDVPEHESFCSNPEVRHYREVIADSPDNFMALNALASILTEMGQADEALAFAGRALALAPENGMILDTYGWIQFKRGDAAAALGTLKKAAAHFPGHPIVLYHLGAAYEATGEKEMAREHLARALGSPGNFEGAVDARALLERIN